MNDLSRNIDRHISQGFTARIIGFPFPNAAQLEIPIESLSPVHQRRACRLGLAFDLTFDSALVLAFLLASVLASVLAFLLAVVLAVLLALVLAFDH